MNKFYNFKNSYILALLILVLFSTLAFLNVKDIIASIKNEGKIINLSGKQRMLSQKIVLLMQNYLEDKNEVTKNDLIESIEQIKNSHNYLVKTSSSDMVENSYYKSGLDLELKKFISLSYEIIESKDKKTLNRLQTISQSLLIKLDTVVEKYESNYEQKLLALHEKGLYLFLGILLVLFFEWILIFRPTNYKINSNINHLENEIKEKIKELQKSIDIISENVIYSRTDTKGFITYASKAFCKISGYTQEELLGKPHNIIRHMDMPKEAFKNMWQTIQSGKSWKGEVKNLKKNRDFYWVMAYISPEYDNNGNLIGYAAVRHDITHKKALQELNKNLEEKIAFEIEKNREKDLQIFNNAKMASLGEMIGNIAHQWRQPLSSISTLASGLLVSKEFGTLQDDMFIKYCNNIVENTKYLSETIDTFRDFIKEKKELKKVILQDRIKTTLQIQNATLNHNHITLIDCIDYSTPIFIELAIGELSQVLINILNNAKDALIYNQIENPWIKISLESNETTVLIIIEDNAGGIRDDIILHIFEPYFTTKHQSLGTGLGLYMSYKIVVENLKGKLYAKNSEFGAKFFIELNRENYV